MSRFLQLHFLTFHAPSNLNRDDTGRPKTAMVGGVERLRISSQAIKRAARTSDAFQKTLAGHLGERTQRLGDELEEALSDEGIAADKALEAARAVASIFGKLKGEKDDNPARIEQLAFVSPQEREAALALARRIATGEKYDEKMDNPLKHRDTAADIAMFGRMLADAPEFNREAAVQVAHAFTTHKAPVEADYYTAVDDLKDVAEDAGAGFIGNTGFGSGVFYLYVCVDRPLLIDNLAGDGGLARDAVAALIRALATVPPTGKQNSFASRACASFILAERGSQQPRSLAGAFLKPIRGEREGDDYMAHSIDALKFHRAGMDRAYGACADTMKVMNMPAGEGTLDEIIGFAAE